MKTFNFQCNYLQKRGIMLKKDQLKAFIIQSGNTMTKVLEDINEKYDQKMSMQSFSAKLKRDSISYNDVEKILDAIGYEIVWLKKEE